jgi:Zn-dependent protease
MNIDIGLGLLWYAAFIVSLTFHEAAHGLTALKLGDPTARDAGLVTLDPLTHMQRSPIGMVIVPIVSFLLGGWMMGWASTPYDPYWAHRHRRNAAFMALAGPAANLALVLVAALLIRGGIAFGVFTAPETADFEHVTIAQNPGIAQGAAVLASVLLSLNLILLVFNLLPLPPLDGSEILTLFLSDSAAERYRQFLAQPGFHMIGLVVAWRLMDFVVGPTQTLALNLLYPGAGYGPH